MSRPMKWMLPVGVLAAALGAWAITRHKGMPPYRTVPVERGDIQAAVSATGNTSAVVTVQVGSQVSGNIKELRADFNSKVHKGDLVAAIDPEPFQARLDQANAARDNMKAAVLTAQANAEKVAADVATSKAQRENLKAELKKAQVAENDAKLKSDRRKQLFAQQLIAKEELDSAESTYEGAVAARNAAESQLSAADASIHSAEGQHEVALAQVEAAKAQVRQAQASVEQAQLDLSHTRITAPVDGVVISRNVDIGQTVAASFQAPVLFVIAQDLTRMQVDTSVDEADIGRVSLGQQAIFTVDAFPGREFPASVRQIRKAPISAQNVVTYDVVLAVSNLDQKLYPGMTASVRILVDEHKNVLKVPNAALRFRPLNAGAPPPPSGAGKKGGGRRPVAAGTQTIYILTADGMAPHKVQTGISDGTHTEIIAADVHEGDLVVVAAPDTSAKGSSSTPQRRGPSF